MDISESDVHLMFIYLFIKIKNYLIYIFLFLFLNACFNCTCVIFYYVV